MNRKTLGINEILNAKSSLLKRKSDEVTKEQEEVRYLGASPCVGSAVSRKLPEVPGL